MAEKLFYSMGEVAEMFDVNASLIRHWESQFSVIRPKRNKKGNRLFSPQDVENLKLIYHLVKERGMTLEGAKKALKQKPAAEGGVQRDAELMERQQRTDATVIRVIGRTVRHDSALSLLHDNVPVGLQRTLHVAYGSDAHPKSIAQVVQRRQRVAIAQRSLLDVADKLTIHVLE